MHLQETYEVGSEHNLENYNIWLPDGLVPGFQETTISSYWRLYEFTRSLLEALVLGAGLLDKERKYVLDLHTGLDSSLRLLHYPPIQDLQQADNSRLGPQTDWG